MSIWYWLDRTPRPGWQQMAIDRMLADHASSTQEVVYRLYRWEGDTVSFGANEAARRTWNREALERDRIAVVRRPTGGRGVWHDANDLTYAVTAPLARYGDLRLAYRSIHEQLAWALGDLGLEASLAPAGHRATLAPGACFEMAVGGEVMTRGRKTIGSAQALFGPAFLQHGAIALADRSSALARFRLDSPPCARPPAAGQLDPTAAAAAILAAWSAAGAIEIPNDFPARTVAAAMEYAERFQDSGWTWRR